MFRDNQGVTKSVGTTVEARPYLLNSEGVGPTRQATRMRLDGTLRRYGLALAFVFAALVLTLPLQPLFPYPFLFLFFAAVIATAWFGGMLPGLFAVFISTLVADYFFIVPFHSFAIKTTELSYFAAFVICSLVASWVSASKKKKRRRTETDAQSAPGSCRRTHRSLAAVHQRTPRK